MDNSIIIIDKFFAEHPAQLKPIRTKSSQLPKIKNDRSTVLKRDRRNKPATEKSYQPEKSNVIKFDRTLKKVELIPRNTAQEEYVDQLLDSNKRIVFAVGPAGTGKTLLAILYSIRCLRNREVSKIVITRPAVSVDEDLGALPGTLIEKMMPYIRPIIDIFEEYYTKAEVVGLLESGVLEVCPLAFIRGRTFKDSIIILDEGQSTSTSQIKAAMTRLGEGSKMIITGDLRQADGQRNGLADFLQRYSNFPEVSGIAISRFAHKDIERDPIISSILEIYGDVD